MIKEEIEEVKELYDTLIELGVVFYYESETIAHGEITDIQFNEDETIIIELNEDEKFEIDIEEFIENHSKEGNNYHTWNLSRSFDSKLNELI